MAENIPQGWCIADLNNLSESITAGGDKPQSYSKEKTSTHNIPIYANGIENNGLYGYTTEPKITKESITVSARGTIGFTCIRRDPFTPIVRLIVIVPLSIVNISFLKYTLDASLSVQEGSSIPQLTVPTIKKMKILLPPINEQRRIVAKVEELFAQLDKIAENL